MLYRDFASQEAIDAAYDPMRGQDPAALLAGWRARSAVSRERHRVTLDIPYGPTLAECLDIFHAEGRADGTGEGEQVPCHLFFHGGYWRSLSHKEFSFVVDDLVAAGISVAVVNYALCPTVRFSEVVRQSRAALAWVYRNAASLGIDPGQISISGHSAGGHLCGMLLATDWQGEFGLPRELIKGALCVSGLYDLGPFPWSWLQPKLQLDGRDVVEFSPLFQACRVPAAVHLAAGGRESTEFARQMQAYAEHLGGQGANVAPSLLEDDDHFTILEHYLTSGQGAGVFQQLIRAFHS
ncbi:alpha/beta hydrolase [Halomonas urumqiensis]|uniref:Esterase n=1 Tax=Halomonas urumqiensis TaxID=1684789 RepID=A0A2N7UCF7_9GAMM|nr:alpha/beta hydrolase [Halomonas urumqiensis]PMR78081.1 esterase [Halomonas urumqiensis]PTB03232.1 alpha/beta hydrolase [Halomonas urumqiensis]GHE20614.1 esterase [Halomonas urumqiensis]